MWGVQAFRNGAESLCCLDTNKFSIVVDWEEITISALGENERSVFNPTSLYFILGLIDLLNLILSGCMKRIGKLSVITPSLHWVFREFTLSTLHCLIQYLFLELNRWCQYSLLLFWSLCPLGGLWEQSPL